MAATTTFNDVICVAPQFEDQQARVEKMIAIACESVDATVWGTKAVHATALLTAHMLTVFDREAKGGGSGEVKRKKLGDTEIEYAVNMSEDMHELATTGYGKEFLRCRRQLCLSPLLAGC